MEARERREGERRRREAGRRGRKADHRQPRTPSDKLEPRVEEVVAVAARLLVAHEACKATARVGGEAWA